MRVIGVILVLLICMSTAPSFAGWKVINAAWRPDTNPYAAKQVWENWRWSEGWSYEEQFYPRLFKPAGSLHVILRNISGKAETISVDQLDGASIDDICTTRERAGRVVWRRVDCPQAPLTGKPGEVIETTKRTVPPGEWVECVVRLRDMPKKQASLGFNTSSGPVAVPVKIQAPVARLEYIGFSSKIDRMYCYVRSLDGGKARTGKVALDGKDISKGVRWQEGPKGSGLTVADVKLNPALKSGTYHLVEVTLADGTHLVQPVIAWDCYFSIGLYGETTKEMVAAGKAKGFNTYYWRDPKEVLAAGLNHVPAFFWGTERQRTASQNGVLFNYNMDEPDCGDWGAGENLPVRDRLGVNAQPEVLPRIEQQRQLDRGTPGLLLLDGTFKPLNYYVYGQLTDLIGSDPYQLLGLDQIDYVRHVMECVRDAGTPRPTIAVLWSCGFIFNDGPRSAARGNGDPKVRPPSPAEERMMVFYALGAGAKGYSFFCDYPNALWTDDEEGKGVVMSENKLLWEEAGRINRDAAALGPYLAIGCPIPSQKEYEKVWVSSILSGPDAMTIIAVNKDHYIGYTTRNVYAWHNPVKNFKLSAALPKGFENCKVREMKDGKLVPVKAQVKGSNLSLNLDTLDTARAFVVTK